MTRHEQEIFYSKVARALTEARKNASMDIPRLVKLSGEQYKTIQSIESGKGCSFHHIVWMRSIFNIDVNSIFMDLEGNNDKKEIKDSLI